jgi:hypothetical protein
MKVKEDRKCGYDVISRHVRNFALWTLLVWSYRFNLREVTLLSLFTTVHTRTYLQPFIILLTYIH